MRVGCLCICIALALGCFESARDAAELASPVDASAAPGSAAASGSAVDATVPGPSPDAAAGGGTLDASFDVTMDAGELAWLVSQLSLDAVFAFDGAQDGGAARSELRGDQALSIGRTDSWAVPSASPTGVACDGDHVWTLSDGGTLQRWSLIDGEVTDEHVLGLGSGTAYGIEVVGERVWIAIAGAANALVQVDKASGEIVRTLSSPGEIGPNDLALGGEGLWLATGSGGIYLLDPESGGVVRSAPLPGYDRANGIAVAGDLALIGDLFGGIWVHRVSDLGVIGKVVRSDGTAVPREAVGPMCFQGERLRVLSSLGLTEYGLALAAPRP